MQLEAPDPIVQMHPGPTVGIDMGLHSLIALEDLPLKFMTANHYLALSAHDASVGEFQQLLHYKAESAGTEVVTVNPAYTSQVCSGCGVIVEKDLSVRVHRCPHCGLTLDRDVNAACFSGQSRHKVYTVGTSVDLIGSAT